VNFWTLNRITQKFWMNVHEKFKGGKPSDEEYSVRFWNIFRSGLDS